ncbi:hypothetical protein HMN09_00121200 [Mycena chlorophos]|uniref:DUF7730 domain-containing protein n=1 Tax=Mycena chlorophos TaxID=658473 RepID=A0A8H6WQJ1_MYCCL|nr:hypothetical protein HMN09_00121200 [Mycena chlorophos]
MGFNSGLLSVIRRRRGPKTRISPRLDLSRHLPSEQPQSPFLSLLPFELRDIIYFFVLGNKHILLYGSIPSARRNTNTAQKNPDVWSCCFTEPVAGPQQTTEAHPSVALLRVCRQIYIEAHGILWRANTFHLSTRHLERILLAPGSLGHFGIAQVQNLVLTYVAFPYDREVFDERERECTLDVLRHFTRLKSLVVCFFGHLVDV